MKVFLDTNILLDILVERDNKEFTENAMTIVELGSDGAIDLYMSILSVTTIAYVLKNMPVAKKKGIIKELTTTVKVLPSLPEHVNEMLESQMKDIEDAMQVLSAREGQCDLIVTRNLKDFGDADMPVIDPKDFLGRILV